jgi:SAM-dependent methyltransferase
MFKLGTFNKERLTPDNLSGFFNSRRFIALDLYNSLGELPRAEIDKIQEHMLHWFRLQNGTQKRTCKRRFDDFDRLSFPVISANFSPRRDIRVHDIGASDGRASCVLYEHLNQVYGERVDFLASDCAPYLYVLKRSRGANRLIIDDQQHVLQIITPPFVFIVFHVESRTLHPLDYLIRLLLTALYARPLLEGYKAGRPGIECTRLELVCQECRAYISRQNNFRFDRYDVLSGPTEYFDIIRAMNILNHDYFSEVQLRNAVNNIIQSLSQGGLFITGSNMERGTIVNGGIYKKINNRMERIETSGKGSKVDTLILNIGDCAE